MGLFDAPVGPLVQNLPAGITGKNRYHQQTTAYNVKASNLRFWRAAVARQAAGGSTAKLACAGDSQTFGLKAGDPVNTGAYPNVLQAMINGVWGPTYDGPIVMTYLGATGTETKPDGRVTYGSGWTLANNWGWGDYGVIRAGSTATGNLTIGPVTCDSFTITFFKWSGGAATSQYRVDGGTVQTFSTNNASNTTVQLTIPAGSVGSHTLDILPPTGTGETWINTVEWNDSSRPAGGIKVSRWGSPGQTAAQIADNGTGKSLPIMFDFPHCPDLAIYMACTNDWRQDVLPATVATSVTTFVTRAKAKNCDVVLVVPIPPGETHTYAFSQYRQALYGVADTQDVPLIDLNDRWPAYAVGNAAPFNFYSDPLHPNRTGYRDVAQAVRSFLVAYT